MQQKRNPELMWLERLFHTQVKPEQWELLAYRAHTFVYVEIPQLLSPTRFFLTLRCMWCAEGMFFSCYFAPKAVEKVIRSFPGQNCFSQHAMPARHSGCLAGRKTVNCQKILLHSAPRSSMFPCFLTGGYKIWCWNGTELKKGAPFCNKAPHRPNNHSM